MCKYTQVVISNLLHQSMLSNVKMLTGKVHKHYVLPWCSWI